MKRHKANYLDIKYTAKSYDNLLPNDVLDRLIEYMTANKISIDDMSERLKMEEKLVEKFWLRIKIPTEFQAELIMKEVEND
ncbi:hypothetical protein Javan425_0041 [Streptococcus phage Javan425]|uniref:Phage protein n=1 Tax=Streptococcus porcinus str. Jelinkova 176 TaxID=873448 RepID=A0ABN0CWP8_STRPO|nr:hypothetical protein [Streptococcus porcinus]EGJ27752.1 hypothetical protein STRPO_0262 [Streptococcus porcinus str. Jelinkova 176]QBX18364.1 hypothetical protein Javan423_0018 [Streptococcus phage Javan423]QBX18446.1 hypothetical protein Javan425_0041 [Streptococcus phage Javan425]SQG43949.1 phage protein [Streptococcus porcinus]